MAYSAIVARLDNLRQHPNADRLQCATCCGDEIIVGPTITKDDLGLYFPSDGVLTKAFCERLSLYRRDGGLFELNGRVQMVKLRGMKSEGFWIPLSDMNKTGFYRHFSPKEGQQITEVYNEVICKKYVNPNTVRAAKGERTTRKQRSERRAKKKGHIYFREHKDTAHLGRIIKTIPVGAKLIITEKMHGTSGRYACLPRMKYPDGLMGRLVPLFQKILPYKLFQRLFFTKQYYVGTRRTVKEYRPDIPPSKDEYRHDIMARHFYRTLRYGETVYGEIVGYERAGVSIMPQHNPSKLPKDEAKAFKKRFGSQITYTYGAGGPSRLTHNDFYIYRITQLDLKTGTVRELSVSEMRRRFDCPTVPHIYEIESYNGDHEGLLDLVKKEGDKPSIPSPDSNPREGVVVRIEVKGEEVRFAKYKTFEFRLMEGIAKAEGAVDVEEAEDMAENQDGDSDE